jgi:hypothetical protein
MTKANVPAAPIERLFAQWEVIDRTVVWRESQRDAFNGVHDWKRWNERHRGKPVDETLGALRVALVQNKTRRKWRVQVILGARKHTFRAYHDKQRASHGYAFAKWAFCADRAQVEAWAEAMSWVRQRTDPADAEADRAISKWIRRHAATPNWSPPP